MVLLSQRLSSYAAENPLYKVIRDIGRIVKTRHILRTYGEPEFRRRVNAGLDRIECFNYLARHIFFARRGENWEREFQEQLNRASSLMIVANPCVLWNAVHLSELVKELREEGFEFEPDDLKHVSLYAFEHIIQYGQYFFNLKRRDRKDALSNAHELLISGRARARPHGIRCNSADSVCRVGGCRPAWSCWRRSWRALSCQPLAAPSK